MSLSAKALRMKGWGGGGGVMEELNKTREGNQGICVIL